jgi:glycerate-2-kinase
VLIPARPERAIAVLKQHDLWAICPASIRTTLESGAAPPGRARRPVNHIIGSNRIAVLAAARAADQLGFIAKIDNFHMRGEARLVGYRFAERLLRTRAGVCRLMGGETTVTVQGDGAGGRNQELALAAALNLSGARRVALMTLATDGVDGPTDAAGAQVTGELLGAAHRMGLDPAAALARNDSYPVLDRLGALIRTGPTGTNVNDLLLGLVYT